MNNKLVKADRFFICLISALLFMSIVAVFNYHFVGRFYPLALLLSTTVMVVTGGIFICKGNSSAKFYLAGWVIIFITIASAYVAIRLGYDGRFMRELFESAILAEALVIFFALSHQVNKIRIAHDEQQQKLVEIYRYRSDEAQNLLSAERDRLTLLEEYKSQLEHIASVSHDMSQPLQAMKMTTQAMSLKDGENPYNTTIKQSVDYLDGLVSKVIRDAKIEYQVQKINIPVDDFFKEAINIHAHEAQTKNIKLSYVSVSLSINTSRVILQRIINNLVNNAVSHTEAGRILLGVRRKKYGLSIQVIDTGKGMKADQVKDLLKPFNTNSEEPQHHGLGLSIIKRLCIEAGYTLGIESKVGKGSVFTISIPYDE